ncbi:Hypothetical protein KQS_07725 [Flavobacterium indicum GPTSA100-9 = DSM 17447]|uniref:Uncharacterized protein n=1 Tax=Flavobacterium indicum (strain DSM 17447 / CIP 109464 / GPTSA100-9) TaxID=1094466 RepID=H8XSV1_FLAIG|nr:Hypothetical protein KQS_07725 [Flavobacterium indicum GPTSA100-9 = DSM 17447]
MNNLEVNRLLLSGIRNWFLRKWYIIRDLVSANSLEANVMDAYIYLMNNYEFGNQ